MGKSMGRKGRINKKSDPPVLVLEDQTFYLFFRYPVI